MSPSLSSRPALTDCSANNPLVRLLLDPEVERVARYVLWVHGLPERDERDGLQEVWVRAVQAIARGAAPANLREMKNFCATIAKRYAITRGRYDARWTKVVVGPCENADIYPTPMPSGDRRDRLDVRRYLDVAAEVLSGKRLPKNIVEIIEGVAAGETHPEIGAQLGITERAVEGRLGRLRKRFLERLVELGLMPAPEPEASRGQDEARAM